MSQVNSPDNSKLYNEIILELKNYKLWLVKTNCNISYHLKLKAFGYDYKLNISRVTLAINKIEIVNPRDLIKYLSDYKFRLIEANEINHAGKVSNLRDKIRWDIILDCRRCNGTGIHIDPTIPAFDSKGKYSNLKCPRCAGTGMIP